MNQFAAIIKQELRCARRERLPQVFLAVLLVMAAVSSFIGWATNHTVTNVYNEVLRQGITTAPSPFTGVSPLFYARNTVIYIVLIGALLAIVLGVQSMLRDRKAQVSGLLLSRPLSMTRYLGAKLLGLSFWLLVVLAVCGLVNWVSIVTIVGHALSLPDTLRLVAFYLTAELFLIPFLALGLINGIYARGETTAYILPIVSWSVITLVLPQLGTAEHPVSLLNPVPAQIAAHGLFFQINQTIFGPLSLAEHFKHVSGRILQDNQVTGTITGSLTIIGLFVVVSSGVLLATRRMQMRVGLYE